MADVTETEARTRNARPVALIVLAAGAGTRMNSDRPKPLHEVGGRPLLAHALVRSGPVARAGRRGDGTWRRGGRGHGRRDRRNRHLRAADRTEGHGTRRASGRRGPVRFQGRRGGALRRHAVSDTRNARPSMRREDRSRRRRAGVRGGRPGPLRSAGDGRRCADADRGVQGRTPRPSLPITTCNSGVMAADAANCWTISAGPNRPTRRANTT
jgi:bifunctional UDP-N-acetylglucosamine pyrophosphorylase/glucosamine-1-phosphate N-acetyltransferase